MGDDQNEGEGVDSDVRQSEGAAMTRIRMKSLRVNVGRGCVARGNVGAEMSVNRRNLGSFDCQIEKRM